MENQHRQITGYRELSAAEIELMNKIKLEGQRLESLVKELRAMVSQPTPPGAPDPLVLDQRWVSIGATHLQEGLMALTRAVARPTSF